MTDEPISENRTIHAHMRASMKLFAACLARLKAEDPEAHQGVTVAVNRGASVRITTALSMAGLREVRVDLVDVHGNAANIATAAFANPTKN